MTLGKTNNVKNRGGNTAHGNGTGKAIVFGVGLAIGAAGMYVATKYIFNDDKPTVEEVAEACPTVDTTDSKEIFGYLVSGLESNYDGLTAVAAEAHSNNRESTTYAVEFCNGLVQAEKDYIKGMFAEMPVLSGSSNIDDLSLDMKIMNNQRVAVIHHNPTDSDYIVTQSEILDLKSLALYKIPASALKAQGVQGPGEGETVKSPAEEGGQVGAGANPAGTGTATTGTGPLGQEAVSDNQQYNPLSNLAKSITDAIPSLKDIVGGEYQN